VLVLLLGGVLPVLLGAAVAWAAGRSRGFLGPARSLALGATLSVVLGELVPEAFEVLGPAAFAWFGAGLVGPSLLERSVRRLGHGAAVDLVLLGLAAHQIADGLQIGAGGRLPDGGRGLMLAIGLHSVPLVAVVCMGHGAPRPRSVALRGGALALCTALGVIGGWVGTGLAGGTPAGLPALLGGLLLHALWHELEDHAPRGAKERAVELVAFVAGLTLPLLVA
jgi:zinc transporter ZupT